MASKVQVLLQDDLDGSEATETVSFGLDGTNYEIDLNAGNAKALREALGPYAEAARKVTAARRNGRRPRMAPMSAGVDNAAVRAWARSNDIPVNDRGRIPAELVVKFQAAGN